MSLTLDSVVTAAHDHLASDLPDETVILSLTQGTYFGVDGVARDVWRLIQRPTPVRAVRDALSEQYDAPPSEIERDLFAFLEELQASHLLTIEQS